LKRYIISEKIYIYIYIERERERERERRGKRGRERKINILFQKKISDKMKI